jgi:hypothetical protein
MDFRTYFERKRGWWIETRATVPCILPVDGLLAVFRAIDVEAIMDANYPHGQDGHRKVWWFHEGKDREIAELDGDRVYANPQVLWDHFLPKESL